MAVKSVSSPRPEQAESVEDDLRELVGLVRPVFVALKRGGPVPAPFQEAFEQASLGPRHVPTLMAVALGESLTVSELAEQLGLSVSTTSLMVGELSRAGLLERKECDEDRRRTFVHMSEEYREPVAEWFAERLEPFRRTLERLSPRARANFLEGWRILGEETACIGKGDG